MKKIFTLSCLFVATLAQAQFSPNNLAVLKITQGTGGAIVDDGTSAAPQILRPVTIMQFATAGEDQTGTAVTVIPSTGNGQPRLTIDQRRLAHEGHLSLSGDRNYLTFVGYSTNEGLLAASGTPNGRTQDKRVARIPASGVADISTIIPIAVTPPATAATYSNNSVRAAVSVDGSSFTIAGSGATATAGVQNATFGDPSTLTSVLQKDCRGIGLFGGTVYAYTSASGTIEGGGNSITLPAPNADLTQFVFLDRDPTITWGTTGFDLLYCADRNGGIRKYSYIGGTWTAVGTAGYLVLSSMTTTVPVGGVQTLTGRLENGKPALYFTKAIVSPYSGSYLLKVVDNAGQGIWDGPGLVASPTYTVMAKTDATERFIGVAFTPGSLIVIPVELTAFKGSLINNKAALQWETAQERNAKAFIVEKSIDAKTFTTIGTVAAKGGASRTSYDFDDKELSQNINYYRLKMVDNDGSFTYSNTIAIKLGGKTKGGVSVFPNPVSDNITINHDAAEEGTIIRIVNITGVTVAQYSVAKDAIQTSVDASQLAKGQYFINFVTKGKGLATTTSFIK